MDINNQYAAKQSIMGGPLGSSIGEAAADGPESAINRLAKALEMVDSLCRQVDSVTIRLIGVEPQVAGQTANSPQPESAVFPLINYGANETIRRVQNAMYQLARIESALP